MARTGRPKKQIDWTEVDKLLYIQCTDEEIAGWFDTDVKTIKAAAKRDLKMTFSQYSEQKKGRGKISLRRELWKRAHDPKNTAALLFSCKTMLGLREYDDSPKSVKVIADSRTEVVIKWTDEDNP